MRIHRSCQETENSMIPSEIENISKLAVETVGWRMTRDARSALERKCHFKIHSSSKLEKQMDLREIQEVKLQGLSDTLDMTERRKWALGLPRAEWIAIAFPVLEISRRAAVGERKNVNLILQMLSLNCFGDTHVMSGEQMDIWLEFKRQRDYKSGKYRYTNSVRNCECGLKSWESDIYQTDRGHLSQFKFQPEGTRAVGLCQQRC